MKKILITGKNSYVGTSFKKWIYSYPAEYEIDAVGTRNEEWRKKDFRGYDVLLHVAGIAHVSNNKNLEELYYKVNRDLTIEVAKKAKASGVKQFIFMSSIIVYGDSAGINDKKIITKDTIPVPSNFYGDSKLQAEKGILDLQDENFNIVILRPPMIYGRGSKGNFPKLSKLARYSPIFPDIKNRRSILYIDNLCQFIKLIIDTNDNGIFFPQNNEIVSTTDLVRRLGKVHNKKIMFTSAFNKLLIILSKKFSLINKIFGNLTYDKDLSLYKEDYCKFNFMESIEQTERNEVDER